MLPLGYAFTIVCVPGFRPRYELRAMSSFDPKRL